MKVYVGHVEKLQGRPQTYEQYNEIFYTLISLTFL